MFKICILGSQVFVFKAAEAEIWKVVNYYLLVNLIHLEEFSFFWKELGYLVNPFIPNFPFL